MAFVGGDTQIAAMKEVSAGDVVLLKRGLSQIVAVGEVVQREGRHQGEGGKDWLRDFDGWDLPAYCYVDWRVPEPPIQTDGLTRATIERVPQQKHREIVDSLLALPLHPFEPEPAPTEEVVDSEILRFLISEGLRPSAAGELTNTISKIRLLSEYYYNHCRWEDVREHETRTFLVVPLLLALGWSEQQMKIEFPCTKGRVDVACFSRAFRGKDDECVILIEAKNFSSGLDFAPEQARQYAESFPTCRVVAVTNGYCYKTYLKSDGGFSEVPSAYLNLLRPRKQYPLDPRVAGALGVLKSLLPISLRGDAP
jgi:hypothetical protein